MILKRTKQNIQIINKKKKEEHKGGKGADIEHMGMDIT